MPRADSDERLLAERQHLVAATGGPLLATNDALYATAAHRTLHDTITCIREGAAIQKAGRLLRANGERHLKAPEEMARLFADHPRTVMQSAKLLARIRFRLDDLRYDYPHEPVPQGCKPFACIHILVKPEAETR